MQIDLVRSKKRMEEDVIKIDVIAARDADFLATHVPFKGLRYYATGDVQARSDSYTEEKLYQEFVKNPDNLHRFIIVRGPNGAGKSHLIRWLQVRLENDADFFDKEKELVVFIRRFESTLRGAVKQLLDAGIVTDPESVKKFSYIINADVTLDETSFKDTILFQFVTAVSNDKEDGIYKAGERERIASFLKSEDVMALLKKQGGPITRIFEKLAGNNKTAGEGEEPLFWAADFGKDVFDLTTLNNMRNNAERHASKFADRLYGDSEQAEKLVKYLNGFVRQVIAHCARIESGDLRKVFISLRQELCRQGKNLTLFIEDFTAFTGIDKELVDVLVTEHGGMNESQKMCRLTSFIGITDSYYEQFRDNFKDRVTAQFEVAANIFGTKESLAEMAARYLNAIYQPYQSLENWTASGASEASLPVSEVSSAFPKWESIGLESGVHLTLFPFTSIALQNLYAPLSLKTPRNFLRYILREHLSVYFHSPQQYPSISKIESKMLHWQHDSHQVYIENLALASEIKARLVRLICIWGEGHVFRKEDQADITVGGLPKEIYEAFGLPYVEGIGQADQRKGIQPMTSPQPMINHDKSSASIAPTITISNTPSISQEYSDLIVAIEAWAGGEPIKTFEKLRDALYSYLLTAINWQAEGVSYYVANKMLSKKIVTIEGQQKTGDYTDGIAVVTRTFEGKMLLIGLAKWEFIGKKTWAFEDAPLYQLYLVRWTQTVKSSLITALNNGRENEEVTMFKCACAAEYLRLGLTGQLTGEEGPNEIMKKMLLLDNLSFEIKMNSHCKSWNDVLTYIKQESDFKHNKDLLRQFYNAKLGAVTEDTTKYFLNAADILATIESFVKKNWDYSDLLLNSARTSVNIVMGLSLRLLRAFDTKIRMVLRDETESTSKAHQIIVNELGSDVSKQDISDAMETMKRFLIRLNTHNIPYEPSLHKAIEQLYDDEEQILKAICLANDIQQQKAAATLQVFLIENPLKYLLPLSEVITKLNLVASRERINVEKLIREKEEAMLSIEGSLKTAQNSVIALESAMTRIGGVKS